MDPPQGASSAGAPITLGAGANVVKAIEALDGKQVTLAGNQRFNGTGILRVGESWDSGVSFQVQGVTHGNLICSDSATGTLSPASPAEPKSAPTEPIKLDYGSEVVAKLLELNGKKVTLNNRGESTTGILSLEPQQHFAKIIIDGRFICFSDTLRTTIRLAE